ncbi:hypothetical protein L7F22_048151 [Adiantum nelumboides]|nr:hypothetical protein [Adiantum nelumboides]
MQIFVKTPSGKILTLEMESSDSTVEDAKRKIAHKENIRPDMLYLSFAGEVLKGVRTLASYNIQNESTLHVILFFRSGGCRSNLLRRVCNSLPLGEAKSPLDTESNGNIISFENAKKSV